MTHETGTLQDERMVDAHKGFDLSLLWLWPILLFRALCDAFAKDVQKLKAMRRATFKRPGPDDWAMHVERLREAEWLSRAYLARHASSLLAGEPVDPSDALVPGMPDDWRRPAPRTVEALLQRFEALTRLHANPMRYIRRLAQRLIAQARSAEHPEAQASAASPADCAPAAHPAAAFIPSWTLGVPAPP
jgi:hypothetical protein